ncbi:MAG: fatty acid desaturase [Acidobacteriota bacterium]|nr:fatty acid desaturase [Acidobacteriota bacterium]
MSKHAIHLANGQKINWVTTLILAGLHIGALAAFFCFSWKAFFMALALHWVAVGWGISLGYHRLHTHQSYQCPRWLEYFFAVCGTMTLEGGPMFWVGTHRVHHAKSDKDGDPHSPREGTFWSHMGWIVFGETNHNNSAFMAKHAPDLARHKFYWWLNTYHWIPVVATGIALLVFGGWPMFLWGFCLRIVYGLHCTWLINSATHIFGSRRFETADDSRNSLILAVLTFGEGWHNNHHAHQTSARHGMLWYEFDISWITLKLLKSVGLVWGVRLVKPEVLARQQEAAELAA